MSLPLRIWRKAPKRLPLSIGFKTRVLSFDGSDDYVRVPYDPVFDLTDNFTIETFALAKDMPYTGAPTWRVIIAKAAAIYTLVYDTYRLQIRFVVTIGGELKTLDYPFTPDGKWHHIVGTFKSNDMRLYFDGEVVARRTDLTGPIDTNTEDIYIGQQGNARWWHGDIAIVRIYDRVLSDDEIRHNMLNYHRPKRDGLLLWFHDKMNESTWFDELGQHDGTIYGASIRSAGMGELRADIGL